MGFHFHAFIIGIFIIDLRGAGHIGGIDQLQQVCLPTLFGGLLRFGEEKHGREQRCGQKHGQQDADFFHSIPPISFTVCSWFAHV